MKKSYYLFNPGRMTRQDNTLKFTPIEENGVEGKARFLPIEGIEDLFCFGSLDMNSAMLNFLGQNHIHLHFFDYYEHYTGSFAPKEYLLAGKVQMEQVKTHINLDRRLYVAKQLIVGATANMIRNIKYYKGRGKAVEELLSQLETMTEGIDTAKDIPALMGVEGNCRKIYYQAFDAIIDDFEMGGRSKQPPNNEINALVSFGNMMCYTTCLGQIYHTQLNPTISFLHEPGTRRFSLSLDIAEVFKPMIVDRVIFRLLNKKEIQAKHFDQKLNACYLNNTGRQIFVRAYEEKLTETLKHRALNRNVSYKHLIRLECYKISKYIMGINDHYKPFKIYW